MTIRAVIIDDEQHAIDMVTRQLERSYHAVEVVAAFRNPVEALKYKKWDSVDLAFVDVQMPKMNGFEFLDILGAIKAQVIFCTAHDEYVLKALKIGALDYLLKPMDLKDLNLALERYQLKAEAVEREGGAKRESRLCVPISHGYEMINVSELFWLQSSNNYTYLHLANKGHPLLITKTLKAFEKRLPSDQFVRVNQSIIVNVEMVEQLDRRDGMSVRLKNSKEFSVSPTYRERIQEVIDRYMI